jgi:hypothetical protein
MFALIGNSGSSSAAAGYAWRAASAHRDLTRSLVMVRWWVFTSVSGRDGRRAWASLPQGAPTAIEQPSTGHHRYSRPSPDGLQPAAAQVSLLSSTTF